VVKGIMRRTAPPRPRKSRSGLGLSRRAFILSAAAVGGGLVLGLRVLNRASGPGHAVEIHNWITVAPDSTTTIRIAKMEMGQGAMTSMAQLLAEELAVDWSKVKTEFISIRTQLRRGRIYGETKTNASRSVRRSQEMLRICGAQIRTMFVRAASEKLGVPASELFADASVVTHVPTGAKLSYGELASAAAGVPIPDPASVKLKEPEDWTVIGRSMPRVDVPSKVDGTATYGIDVKLPGMKYAALVMCPVFGGTLKSYDDSNVRSKSGIVKLVEIKANGKVDALAVVGNSWWQAKMAADAIAVKWDAGGRDAIDNAEILADMRAGLDGPPDTILLRAGNVDAAMASAARLLEADYFVPYLEHATMEPMNCTALVTDEGFEVWAPTQAPEEAIKIAADITGIPVEKGDLHVTQIGGGFGRRLKSDFVAQAVQIAKAMKGTPVKLVWSREDTTRHGFYRPATLVRIRGALDAQGSLAAWAYRIVAPTSNETLSQVGASRFVHAIPNMLVDLVVKANHVPLGEMRSVSLATHNFAVQCFIDELARSAGKDPYEFQRAMLDPDKASDVAVNPRKISPRRRASRLRAVLDEAALKSDWRVQLGPRQGRGISAIAYADAFYAVVVEVTLDGRSWFTVDRVVVAGDPGFLVNPDGADAQVEGSVAFGLTSALYGEITVSKGGVAQGNFNDYPILRVGEMPRVETHWVLSRQFPFGGLGEPITAAVTPALVNAIFDAGGPRIRSLPLKNHRIVRRQD
jgi:isoquinoline 1-oxidoreductase subunit beta